MDNHKIPFQVTTIDIVRFKNIELNTVPSEEEETANANSQLVFSPDTIWIGVFPDSTTATAAHYATQDILAVLQKYQITDVDVDFRESIYTRNVGPVGNLDSLVDVVSPLTPALGLSISTKANPDCEGTMTLYLAEGSGSSRLLGLSCRHLLIGSQDGNLDYSYHQGGPTKDVILFGEQAFCDVIDSIKVAIRKRGILDNQWEQYIEEFEEREKGNDTTDVEEAKADRILTEILPIKAEKGILELAGLFDKLNNDL